MPKFSLSLAFEWAPLTNENSEMNHKKFFPKQNKMTKKLGWAGVNYPGECFVWDFIRPLLFLSLCTLWTHVVEMEHMYVRICYFVNLILAKTQQWASHAHLSGTLINHLKSNDNNNNALTRRHTCKSQGCKNYRLLSLASKWLSFEWAESFN